MFKGKDSVVTGFSRAWRAGTLLVMAAVLTGACDKAQLLAPTSSTITVSAPTRVLPSGGSTEVTAFVVEQGGTPVQNGTTVRFTATMGRVDPVEVQTRNGLALTTFFAGNSSGIAEVRATSGAASGGTDKTNVVQLTIGAAAVNTVTLRANPGSVGPNGGTVELIATVVGENGQALDRVGVTFNTDQGTLSATNVTTNANGEAKTTLTTSRQAVVSATAGTKTSSNVTISAVSVSTVTLRANPGSVAPLGGSVELVAVVVSDNGQPLADVGVTFNADHGTLRASLVATNANGEARTTLTTSQQTVVSATAGTKSSGNVTIAVRSGPTVTIACAPASGTGNCAAVQASGPNTATVVFTVTKPTGSSTLRTATLDFGDDTSQSLGNLAGGSATITHTYAGPSGSTARAYTATVQATDINGESASVSTSVIITARAPLNVTISSADKETATASGQRWKFTATAKEGTADATIKSYTWDFGDDSDDVTTSGNTTAHVYTTKATPQRYTVTVTAETPDGRTATGRTEILVDDNTP